VTLLAISADSSADSKEFAARAGLNFPLLADPGDVAREYVGLNYDDTAIPGVVIIRPDGHIAFRQVATAKDDRLSAAKLIDTLDRTLGTKGAAVDTGHFAALDRFQNRTDLGTGEVRESGQRRVSFFASRSLLVPLNHYLLVGPWLATEPRQAPLDIDAAVMLRLPFLADIAAFEVSITAGWTPWEVSGWNVGARIGLWYAASPKSAYQLSIGYDLHRFLDSDRIPAVFLTLGVTKLLWKPTGPIEP
jgi:hypothetical protein